MCYAQTAAPEGKKEKRKQTQKSGYCIDKSMRPTRSKSRRMARQASNSQQAHGVEVGAAGPHPRKRENLHAKENHRQTKQEAHQR